MIPGKNALLEQQLWGTPAPPPEVPPTPEEAEAIAQFERERGEHSTPRLESPQEAFTRAGQAILDALNSEIAGLRERRDALSREIAMVGTQITQIEARQLAVELALEAVQGVQSLPMQPVTPEPIAEEPPPAPVVSNHRQAKTPLGKIAKSDLSRWLQLYFVQHPQTTREEIKRAAIKAGVPLPGNRRLSKALGVRLGGLLTRGVIEQPQPGVYRLVAGRKGAGDDA